MASVLGLVSSFFLAILKSDSFTLMFVDFELLLLGDDSMY